jgi:protein-S-isoprenylcysteine O-methyltransferase Ste14
MRIWATTWIAGRKRQSVVNDGPYALTRNPLYVGTFPTATLRWQADRHFTLSVTWVGYAFGAFVTESRPEQDNGNYLQLTGTFKF